MIDRFILLVGDLLIPAIMLIFGYLLEKHPPKKINGFYGYRTALSRKNADTWHFANTYLGRLWFRVGWVVLALTVLAALPLAGREMDTVSRWGTALCLLQLIPLLWPVVCTERALRERFDKNGRRK